MGAEPKPLRGQITEVVGMLVKAILPDSKIGELCELRRPGIKEPLDAADSADSAGKISVGSEKTLKPEGEVEYAEGEFEFLKNMLKKAGRLQSAGERAVTNDPVLAAEHPDLYVTKDQLVTETKEWFYAKTKGKAGEFKNEYHTAEEYLDDEDGFVLNDRTSVYFKRPELNNPPQKSTWFGWLWGKR